MLKEIYVSTDIETDGPIPGEYSMLSLGSAAFDGGGALKDHFSVNLEALDGARQDPGTMKWWRGRPSAWEECRRNVRPVKMGMSEYAAWIDSLPGRAVFVGYPAGFDFLFVYWYLMKFVGRSPFGFSAIDVKTYATALLGTDYRATTKKSMPKRWFNPTAKHAHVALDDAIEQGHLFAAMLAERRCALRRNREEEPCPSGSRR